jgi:stage V sporulation protein R
MIAQLRSENGRWVDYVIEFARGIDNLVGYHAELSRLNRPPESARTRMLDYYFDHFLQNVRKVSTGKYIKEIERYNACRRESADHGEQAFFAEVFRKHPEFDSLYKKSIEAKAERRQDLMQFILEHSEFLAKEKNRWMKPVVEVVRKTSLFFQPQIRTKIMNEGWASYWHEALFLQDDRISGHEVDFARVHAGVTAMPRVGLNPYALGMRLFQHIEELAGKGKYSIEFRRLTDRREREHYDRPKGGGRDFLFKLRENLNDFLFINTFVEQDFVDRFRLFVAGRRLNQARGVWEIYVKSRSADEYRAMLLGMLYHPPAIDIDREKTADGALCLVHRFEGRPLVREFIANTLIGLEFLWGRPVQLETSEAVRAQPAGPPSGLPGMHMPLSEERRETELKWQRVRYTLQDRKLTRDVL